MRVEGIAPLTPAAPCAYAPPHPPTHPIARSNRRARRQRAHHEPLGEDGDGLYSKATKGCFDVIANASDLVLDAVAAAPAPAAGAPFALADFGTADGGTSMPLMGRAISAIRERLGDDTEVLVQYEDQPFNEWKSLFNYTQGTQRLPGVPVYTEEHSNVFVTASGTSFYEQCYPTASVQVGMSFTAMHWLSKLPCDLQATLHSTQAEPDEKAKFMAQVRAPLTLLCARASCGRVRSRG